MGLSQSLVYLDSCVIIYLVEEHPLYAPLIEARLQNSTGAAVGFSALSEMECLVLPLRNQNQPLLDKFRDWFARADYLPLERAVFAQAAQLRATHPSLKTPDAIHLAAALHHGCVELWTNDGRLNAIAPGLAVKVT